MNIKKTTLPDGREGIIIYADPDIISEMVALCKQRNIPVDQEPEISQATIEQLSKIKKDVRKSLEIEKVIKMANKINTPDEVRKSNASFNKTTQDKLKQIINNKNGGE